MVKIVDNIATLEYDVRADVLKIVYNPVVVDDKAVRRVIDVAWEFAKAEKFGVLIDLRQVVYVTKEARDVAAKYKTDKILAQALVFNRFLHKQIYNLFIKFHKPDYPVKAFSNYDEALKWIIEQVRLLKIQQS